MRVIVVEDMLLVREGLIRLLEERGVEVADSADSAVELMPLIERHQPDVVILDIRMPPNFTDDGLVAAAEVRRRFPQVAILVLSQYLETAYAIRLLREAPDRVGYLLKDRVMDIATVVDSLRRLTEGETVIDPTIVTRILGRQRVGSMLQQLTARETEVLALLAEGLSNQAIARRLHVNARTVETHTTQIFLKFGLDPSPDAHRRVLAVLTYLRSSD